MWVSRQIRKALKRFAGRNGGQSPRTGYVVYSGSYISNSAGVQCLHRLCSELNARGYPAFTAGGEVSAPHLNAPMLDHETALSVCADGFCAIYPETVRGNPFGAANVVRWVLNRPGLLGGDRLYSDSEKVFTYSDVFAPYVTNRITGKLYMPTLNERLFHCDDDAFSNRNLECFYVGKSQWQDGIVDPTSAYEITRENPRRSELGKLFRASKVLYCFDNSTALIYEALFCGCPVVVIPDGTQTKADYDRLELGTTGISWGLNDHVSKRVDLKALRDRYHEATVAFADQLAKMIGVSQANAPSIVGWSTLVSKQFRSDVTKRVRRAPGQFIQTLDRYSRNVERTIRRGRRYCLGQKKPQCGPEDALKDSNEFFRDKVGDFSTRRLQCFSSAESVATNVFDRAEAVEVSLSIPAKEIGKLFRLSRSYFTFVRQDPLIECALRCGCPVTVIGKKNQVELLAPTSC